MLYVSIIRDDVFMVDNRQSGSRTERSHRRGFNSSFWISVIAGVAVLVILATILMQMSETPVTHGKEKTIRERSTGELEGSINGQEWVDLGLPSGLKWATCNVGATTAEEAGDYFAWGETEPKADYSSINSLTYKVPFNSLKENGIIDASGTLTQSHDAASVNWGYPWRMPSDDEYKELIESCTWEFITSNKVNGYLVTGPNNKSIFLIASAYQQDSTVYHLGEFGDYWSSTIVKELTGVSCSLGYSPKSYGRRRYDRYFGRTVRAVAE